MMTPLRQRMIDDMRIRNFAEGTQRSYIHYVAGFAKYFNLSPELLDLEAVRQYQLFLNQERKLSPQSINCFVSAVQFLYTVTLEMPWKKEDFPRPRLEERLPVVPSLEEVEQFFDNLSGLENRAVLMTCYGAGLRIAEAVSVKIDDVDKQRMLLRVEQGKGGKDHPPQPRTNPIKDRPLSCGLVHCTVYSLSRRSESIAYGEHAPRN
jgi:integrase/recombinase XerD